MLTRGYKTGYISKHGQTGGGSNLCMTAFTSCSRLLPLVSLRVCTESDSTADMGGRGGDQRHVFANGRWV